MNKQITKHFSLVVGILLLVSLFFGQIALSPVTLAEEPTDKVLFAKCDGSEGGIFHPGGGRGKDREFKPSNAVYQNNYRVIREGDITFDMTNCNEITFEFFVKDSAAFDEWKSNMAFYVASRTPNEENPDNPKESTFIWPMITESKSEEWHTVVLDLALAKDKLDLKNIWSVGIKSYQSGIKRMNEEINFDLGWDKSTKDLGLALQNIYGQKSERDTESILDAGNIMYFGTGTSTLNWANNAIEIADTDFTKYRFIEFDFFVNDIEALRNEKYKNDADKALLESTNLRVFNKSGGFMLRSIDRFIEKSGWTTIKFPLDSFKSYDGGKWGEMNKIEMYMEANGATADFQQNYVIGMANIRLSELEVPEAVEGELLPVPTATYMHWHVTTNANHANTNISIKDAPIDISHADYLEFDFYVTDYKKLKAEKLFDSFNVRLLASNENAQLFHQGSFQDQIVKDGWNHIKLDISDFINHEGNLGNIYKVTFHLEQNQTMICTHEQLFGFANILVNKKEQYVGPENPDSALKPDENSYYLSSCETLTDGGVWSPSDITVDTRTKTEGKASLTNTFTNKSARSNSFRILTNNPFKMKKDFKLKFDLFASNAKFLSEKTKVNVRLYSDSRGNDDYIEWALDLSKLKDEWNNIELLPGNYTEKGTFDFENINGFYLYSDDVTFEEEESVVVKLDNLRIDGVYGSQPQTPDTENPEENESTDDNNTDNTGNGNTSGEIPATGVSTNFVILGLSFVALIGIFITGRKLIHTKN